MDKKLVRNYIYNIMYQLVKIILPLILVPYTASHLGATTLGTYQYAASIMNWFILFGILGVNTYGNRQIARVRDHEEDLCNTFFEVFAMQLVNMIIAMIAFYVFVQFTVDENLLYYRLTGLTMIASMLDITWFFYGVEDFKRASLRSIIVKIVGVSLIMTLVKKPEDIWIYILINVGSELLGQAIMFIQLRHYIKFRKISLKKAYEHHFKATFQLFVPTIAISVYTMLDKTMLGALYSTESVEYYQVSMSLIQTFMYFITSIGSVVLPRITNVFYNKKDGAQEAQNMINTTMKIAMMLALPMCFGLMLVAPNFISWYIPKWPIVGQLISLGTPLIILISMSNVTGIQYMVPTGMYSQYSTSVVCGSVLNFLVNIYMIPHYGPFGALFASVAAECTVTGLQLFFIRKHVKINFLQKSYFVYIIGTLLMALSVRFMVSVTPMNMFGTLAQVAVGMVVYFLVLLVSREDLCMKVVHKARRAQNA